MNLRSLAFRNVWRNRGRYLAYLFSAAFSVTIYFLYTALAHHPDLQGGFRGASYARVAIEGASVVIAGFTLLFLLYSGAAFVRFRMKEFGLLTLLGVTKRQIVRLILWENVVVALAALAIGLAAGVLFLKLFFMAVSAVLGLEEALPFFAGRSVWEQTAAVFGSFFAVVSLASLRHVLRRNIIELIRAERKPKESPVFSRRRTLAGLVLVAAGYAWACAPNPLAVVIGVVPVTAMVSLGTYLLLREGSIALLSFLRRRERFYYRPRPLLIVSQMLFKMQDNYRALSAVALLVAVILSAVGTVYAIYMEIGADTLASSPHAVQLALSRETDSSAEIALVDEALDRHRVKGLQERRATVIPAQLGDLDVNVISYSTYLELYRPAGRGAAIEEANEAVIVHPSTFPNRRWPEGERRIQTLRVGELEFELSVTPDYKGALFNGRRWGGHALAVPDEVFGRVAQASQEHAEIVMWSGPGWNTRAVRAAVGDLRAGLSAEASGRLTTAVEEYHGSMREVGLTLFIGVFVSLVFFAAACSLLYFRLFTEIDEDRRYYRKLGELGLDAKEIYRLTRAQSGLIFLAPFLIGLVHSSFAMNALGTLIMRTVIHWGWMIALGYLVIYMAYFAAAHALYWQAMRDKAALAYSSPMRSAMRRE